MVSSNEIDEKLSKLESEKQELIDMKENVEARAIIEQCKDFWRSPAGKKAFREGEVINNERE